jgi:hypothetical protein
LSWKGTTMSYFLYHSLRPYTQYLIVIALFVSLKSFANDAVNPHGEIDLDCNLCHLTTSWTEIPDDISFSHNADTRYILAGAHLSVSCLDCHQDNLFKDTASDCQSCHMDIHEAQLDADCAYCHDENSWEAGTRMLDLHDLSAFPLFGSHRSMDCAACHDLQSGFEFSGTPTICSACHMGSYEQATDPDHLNAGFGVECSQCHETQQWSSGVGFKHLTYPLTGQHKEISCLECHIDNQFNDLALECVGCHQNDFNIARDPDHNNALLGYNCISCHDTEAWRPAEFDHFSQTQYALSGAHEVLNCLSCHITESYQNTANDCWSCHNIAYETTNSPNHSIAIFNHDCTICHTQDVWVPSTFDHQQTDWPLMGAHASVDCASCHQDGIFSGTPQDCWSCHETIYNQSTDPNHLTAGLDHDCTICHTQDIWTPSTFDHQQTDWPLLGAHASVDCASCHQDGIFSETPHDCWSCHESIYNQSTDPNHLIAGLDHDCTICHTQDVWTPSTFDHQQTDWPLLGAHASVDCASCHQDGILSGTPQDCWSCHEINFNEANDPDHAASSFDHDCAICHTQLSWSPATFDHDLTEFPLTGAHVQTDCAQCHLNGQYSGTPDECFFCHENDWDQTNDPDHDAAAFPVQCDLCHSTSDWDDAQFQHLIYFPIYSGSHAEEWNSCADCHLDQSDFSSFSCIDCHEHRQSEVDGEHDDVDDYIYASWACLDCHPTGKDNDFRLPDDPREFKRFDK